MKIPLHPCVGVRISESGERKKWECGIIKREVEWWRSYFFIIFQARIFAVAFFSGFRHSNRQPAAAAVAYKRNVFSR
jgi:hypothetical protein